MGNYAKIRERDSKGQFIVPTISSEFEKKEYSKKYYLKNKVKKKEQALSWSRNNKERRNIIKNRWRSKNRDRTNFLARRHIYLRKNASGNHTSEELEHMKNVFFGMCAYCFVKEANTIDHIIPLSRGGSNYIYNLLPACVSCNSKKSGKLFSEWSKLRV